MVMFDILFAIVGDTLGRGILGRDY